jgi:hypothetical protein
MGRSPYKVKSNAVMITTTKTKKRANIKFSFSTGFIIPPSPPRRSWAGLLDGLIGTLKDFFFDGPLLSGMGTTKIISR